MLVMMLISLTTWAQTASLNDKFFISTCMEAPAGPYPLNEVVTLYFNFDDSDEDEELSITIHDEESYEMDCQYTPRTSFDLNSNTYIESLAFEYFDIHHGGWFTITEPGYYDFIVSYNGDNYIVTAYPHDSPEIGKTCNMVFSGRTLYCDGSWNTLCLPFSLASLEGTPLDGFTVKELDIDTEYNGHKTGISGSTLYLNFKDATAIEAGKPYIVKKTPSESVNVESPVFNGVTIDSTEPTTVTSEDGMVSFIGNYAPVTLAAYNRSVLYFGSSNRLYYPTADVPVNAFRAHFTLNGTQVGGDAANAKGITGMVIDFGDDEATSIHNVEWRVHSSEADAWYGIDGHKLEGRPAKSGMYINSGRKIAIK